MTIRAVLYSDQEDLVNVKVDHRLLALIGGGGKKIGYIPAGPDPEGQFLKARKAHYAQYDLDLSVVFDLDHSYNQDDIEDLFSCDAIHLSGGNTVAFLKRLKRAGMLDPLRDWAVSGGVLVGSNAGAMMLTPTIAANDLLFRKSRKKGDNPAAMGLLPFEFFPHLNGKSGNMDSLVRYSIHTPRPIIACPDGAGVIVSNGSVECIGEMAWILKGAVYRHQMMSLDDIGLAAPN